MFDAERPETTFGDVAGYEGAKREVAEVVDFLKHPDRYRRAGAVGPKGVLMVGPPGTGRRCWRRRWPEAMPFISVLELVCGDLFVGVGAARVRDLFAEAGRCSIVFIDEIVPSVSVGVEQVLSNDERDQTLNQMLSEMDGFDPATGVVVMAATNRPRPWTRPCCPSRFDRQVVIPLPTPRPASGDLGGACQGQAAGPDVDLEVVARGTRGSRGRINRLVNEAAIFAVRAGREVLSAYDFAEGRDRILLGRRDSSNALLPDEKRAVAA